MEYMKTFVIGATILFFAAGAVSYYAFDFGKSGTDKRRSVVVRGYEFTVEVADTPARRSEGLSGRRELKRNEGMLFVFEEPRAHGFWMKDMLFPIDIIWIRKGQIIGFSPRAKPEIGKSVFELPVYYPPEEVDAALEINAGLVEEYGFAVGDRVSGF